MLPSWVMVLKLSKKIDFLQFCADLSQKLVEEASVLKQFTYIDLKVFITVFQKVKCLIGVWATVHEILAIKISKKTVKILISDQMAFATVVYFGRVFAFCRLIIRTRTMTRSTLFSRKHPTLLLIKKRRSTDATEGLLSKIFAIFTRKSCRP